MSKGMCDFMTVFESKKGVQKYTAAGKKNKSRIKKNKQNRNMTYKTT